MPLRNPDGLEDTEPGKLTEVEGVCAAAAATPLLTEMRGIIREQAAEHLDSWLEKALQGDVAEVAIFAAEVRRELAEPVPALELPWSTGPVEGRITRLKLVKRKGYGWPAWRRSNGASSTPPDHGITAEEPGKWVNVRTVSTQAGEPLVRKVLEHRADGRCAPAQM